MGGFGKEPDDYPDPFHSYLAIAALALSHIPSTQAPLRGEEVAEQEQGVELGVPEANFGLGVLDPVWNIEIGVGKWLRDEIKKVKVDYRH